VPVLAVPPSCAHRSPPGCRMRRMSCGLSSPLAQGGPPVPRPPCPRHPLCPPHPRRPPRPPQVRAALGRVGSVGRALQWHQSPLGSPLPHTVSPSQGVSYRSPASPPMGEALTGPQGCPPIREPCQCLQGMWVPPPLRALSHPADPSSLLCSQHHRGLGGQREVSVGEGDVALWVPSGPAVTTHSPVLQAGTPRVAPHACGCPSVSVSGRHPRLRPQPTRVPAGLHRPRGRGAGCPPGQRGQGRSRRGPEGGHRQAPGHRGAAPFWRSSEGERGLAPRADGGQWGALGSWGEGASGGGAQSAGEPPERMPQGKWANGDHRIEHEPMGRPLWAEVDQWGCSGGRDWPMGCRAIGIPRVVGIGK